MVSEAYSIVWNFLGRKPSSKHKQHKNGNLPESQDFKAWKDRFEAQKKSKKEQNYEHN